MLRTAFVLLLMTTTAAAAPRLIVKARAAVAGLKALHEDGSVHITGTVRDNLGQPVPHGLVRVALGDQRIEVHTDPQGKFEARLTANTEGQQTLTARFVGSSLLGEAVAKTPIRVGKNQFSISLQVAPHVEADRPVTVGVRVVDEDGQAVPNLTLRVFLDGQSISPTELDAKGVGGVTTQPLQPGVHKMRVYWPGDRRSRSADAEIELEATRALQVSLKASSLAPAPDQPVVLSGEVLGPNQVIQVRLLARGRPIIEGQTDRKGRYHFLIEPGDVPVGKVVFRVLGRAETRGWRDALSPTVTVVMPRPLPPSPWWLWGPLALAGLSLSGLLVHFWQRRPKPRAKPVVVVPKIPPAFEFEVSEKRVRGPLVITLRDGLTGRVLQGITVRVQGDSPGPAQFEPPSGERQDTTAQGEAIFTQAVVGDKIWAFSPGYAPACQTLPQASGRAFLSVLPIRARLQTLYAELLEAAGRPQLRFGTETPREAAAPLRMRGAPAHALAALTALIERTCYGAGDPSPEDLIEAVSLAAQVKAGIHI